eukprot:3752713-Rhodomonas_salina.2
MQIPKQPQFIRKLRSITRARCDIASKNPELKLRIADADRATTERITHLTAFIRRVRRKPPKKKATLEEFLKIPTPCRHEKLQHAVGRAFHRLIGKRSAPGSVRTLAIPETDKKDGICAKKLSLKQFLEKHRPSVAKYRVVHSLVGAHSHVEVPSHAALECFMSVFKYNIEKRQSAVVEFMHKNRKDANENCQARIDPLLAVLQSVFFVEGLSGARRRVIQDRMLRLLQTNAFKRPCTPVIPFQRMKELLSHCLNQSYHNLKENHILQRNKTRSALSYGANNVWKRTKHKHSTQTPAAEGMRFCLMCHQLLPLEKFYAREERRRCKICWMRGTEECENARKNAIPFERDATNMIEDAHEFCTKVFQITVTLHIHSARILCAKYRLNYKRWVFLPVNPLESLSMQNVIAVPSGIGRKIALGFAGTRDAAEYASQIVHAAETADYANPARVEKNGMHPSITQPCRNMANIFSNMTGFTFPNTVMNGGPLPPTSTSGMQAEFQTPDGMINETSALLDNVSAYSYGPNSQRPSTQTSYINHPHRIQKVIPKMFLPGANGDMGLPD